MQLSAGMGGELTYLEVAPPDAPPDLPLVVAIPMGPGRALEREYLEQMIRRVIGYQVRLR